MGYHHSYITSRETDADLLFDVERLVQWLVDRGIVKPDADRQTQSALERLRIRFDDGPHTERLLDPNFSEPGNHTVRESLVLGRAFDCRLEIYNLPNPVPIPLRTHNYPSYCPGCNTLCDESFQSAWFQHVEAANLDKSFFEVGLPLEFEFICDHCLAKVTLGGLVSQGEILHRRCFVEFYYSCYQTKNPDVLSTEAREVMELAFAGPLTLRSGWTS